MICAHGISSEFASSVIMQLMLIENSMFVKIHNGIVLALANEGFFEYERPVSNEFTPMLIGCFRFQDLGFEKGWGNTAARVLQNLRLLLDLLQAPDPDTLEKFLARIPMVFTVVIVSPHGYFGQAGVLGLPDTGGQV